MTLKEFREYTKDIPETTVISTDVDTITHLHYSERDNNIYLVDYQLHPSDGDYYKELTNVRTE